MENQALPSGYYLVKIGGEAVSVYCDMVTDGGKVFYLNNQIIAIYKIMYGNDQQKTIFSGGWTMVANITTTRTVLQDEAVSSNVNELSQVRSGKYLLSSPALYDLHNKIGFKQFRVHCHKPTSRYYCSYYEQSW